MNNKEYQQSTGVVVSPSQIQYTIITPQESITGGNFFNALYNVLKSYPKDLLQLRNSLEYFKMVHNGGIRKGLNLYTIPDFFFNGTMQENITSFNSYSNAFNKDLCKVFIIDASIERHSAVAEMINQLSFAYYIIIGEINEDDRVHYNGERAFETGHELIKLLEKDLSAIDDVIYNEYGFRIGSFNLAVDELAPQLNPIYPTLYATPNYFLLNTILANYWLERRDSSFNQEPLQKEERTASLMNQITVIDNLHRWAWDEKDPVTPIEPYYPSMIILAPFHFPRYGKLLGHDLKAKKNKLLLRASQTEQSPDYTYVIESDIADNLTPGEIAGVLGRLTSRLILLDNIGYLHAQLSHSPLYRLPIVGKTLNMDLSHFQGNFPNKKAAIRKIDKLGNLMRERMLPDILRDYVSERNGQLVFISDLPMEWLKLTKYPLLLTHDVCRIPEFNQSSLLNNYIHNQRLSFRIRPDIVKRTLIIHCASEDDYMMQRMFNVFGSLKDSLGFKSATCKSVADIKAAVEEYKPDLLIFDCHGNFNEKDLSSYLVIDQSNDILLTGEDIIEHRISAPLVFISACSTMPNYGYVKFLTDAFFQAGAFVVTATFLPIKVLDASALIIRLLNNLKYQDDKVIFSNWLAFVCHTLRSMLIYETVRKERARNNIPENIDVEEISHILLELMNFNTRDSAFDSLLAHLQTINSNINVLFENLEHEWLSYTTIGRADLIYYEKWLNKHQKEHLGQSFL